MSFTHSPKRGLSTPAWVGIGVAATAFVVMVGLVVVFSVGAFHAQNARADAGAAKAQAATLATGLRTELVENPVELPAFTANGDEVVLTWASGYTTSYPLTPGVEWGGFAATSMDDWCLWVTSAGEPYRWTEGSSAGSEPGDCS